MLLKLRKEIYIIRLRFEKLPERKGGNKVGRISEKYTLLQLIGSGQSCKVYLAEHKKLHYTCVVKCINKAEHDSDTISREIQFLKHLRKFYVPALYDLEEDADYWYLVEEYLAGQSLEHLKKSQNYISQSRLAQIASMICDIIQWLHEQKPYPVLYLDLKPEHLILTNEGMKILDFGSAVYLKGAQITGRVMGTKGFASPEQQEGGQIDVRSDIYSIGAVLYWLMTGETPGYAVRVGCTRGYSKEWQTIVCKCISLDKDSRYASAGELKRAVMRVCKKEKKGWWNKSLTIAVTGTHMRVGTTHFSVGLCQYCNLAAIPCLYEEKNDSAAVQEMYMNCRQSGQREGIYRLPGFEAVPKYGQAVCMEEYGERMLVCDYGKLDEGVWQQIQQMAAVIVVAGGKEWEIRQTKDLIGRYRKRRDMYYVLRTSSFGEFLKLKKELRVDKAFFMPSYENPFKIGWKECRFYKSVLACIEKGLVRSIKNT